MHAEATMPLRQTHVCTVGNMVQLCIRASVSRATSTSSLLLSHRVCSQQIHLDLVHLDCDGQPCTPKPALYKTTTTLVNVCMRVLMFSAVSQTICVPGQRPQTVPQHPHCEGSGNRIRCGSPKECRRNFAIPVTLKAGQDVQ